MIAWAFPGARCVCINDNFNTRVDFGDYSIPVRVPMLNEVLTIREVVGTDTLRCGVGLYFWEIDKEQRDGPVVGVCTWAADYFRPLMERTTDISVFTGMLKTKELTQ